MHEFLVPNAETGELPLITDQQTRILAEEIEWCLKHARIKTDSVPVDVRKHLDAVTRAPYSTDRIGRGILSMYYLTHDVFEKYWGKQ